MLLRNKCLFEAHCSYTDVCLINQLFSLLGNVIGPVAWENTGGKCDGRLESGVNRIERIFLVCKRDSNRASCDAWLIAMARPMGLRNAADLFALTITAVIAMPTITTNAVKPITRAIINPVRSVFNSRALGLWI